MKASLIREINAYLRETLRTRGHIPDSAWVKDPGKIYPRMPRMQLPALPKLSTRLSDILNTRASCRESSLSNPVTVKELSTLLGYSLGSKTPGGKRRYPSGGGLLPLEAYLIINKVPGLSRSVYHYDPDAHALEELWSLSTNLNFAELFYGYEFTAFSSCILIFTCAWNRTRKKYSDFSYLISLIESGGAGHNINLVGSALGLCVCNIAGFNEERMQEMLDLPEDETPLYSIAIGKKARA